MVDDHLVPLRIDPRNNPDEKGGTKNDDPWRSQQPGLSTNPPSPAFPQPEAKAVLRYGAQHRRHAHCHRGQAIVDVRVI
jgi:hypothetical protein